MESFCSININGKQVGLKFGLFAVRLIVDRVDTSRVGESYAEGDYAHILYAGYRNNCMVKEIQEELSFENFVDYIDESTVNKNVAEIVLAMRVFNDSKVVTTIAANNKKKEPAPKVTVKARRKK